jgi:predicted ATPase/class 3 adenylate cyclase
MPDTVFLFTDIEGSTRLWEQQPEAMSVAVARHDQLLRSVVTSHDGVVVKMSGDGIHAVFVDVHQALTAAVAIQRHFDDQSWPGLKLTIRCGLHAGSAESRDGDYYGTAVNRAARLCNAANGGQIIFSHAVFVLIGEKLAKPLEVKTLGTLRLRDLSEAETVYQLQHPALPADFPALRQLSTNPNNLPFLLNSFVGRFNEISNIGQLFKESRLVTLIGIGGIGKTRLALQASANLLDRFADGVWVVPLAAITETANIAAQVMQVLALRPQGSLSIEAQLIEHLRDKKTLLVLDNCEHVIDGAAHFCTNLLQQSAHTYILATSREGLEIDGEAAYSVPVLALPDPDFSLGANLPTVSTFAQIASVRLFLDRAALNCPSFRLVDDEVATLARICFRLDGIPLAIELAAACLRTMTLTEIDRGMDDRFGLLVSGSRVAAPRQKTLQATLAWSYALLNDDERALFAQLAIFSGGGSFAAVAKICDLRDDNAARLIQALADKSLIQLTDVAGEKRFTMLETLRQFGKLKLDENPQHVDLMTQYANWFQAHIAKVAPLLFGENRVSLLAQIDADIANLRVTIQYFINVAPLNAIDCAVALGRFWLWRGQYVEARDFLEAAMAAQLCIGEIPYVLETKARYLAGGHCYMMSELVAAEQHYRLALKAGELAKDDVSAGAAMSGLAMVAYVQHGYAASKKLFEDSIVLSLRGKDYRMAANNLANHVNNAGYANDIDTALRFLAQLETLSAQFAEPMTNARLASSHGQSLLHRGHFAEAASWFRRNLEIARQMSDKSHIGIGRFLLATALTGMDDFNDAASEFIAAINMLSESNARIELCNAIEAFAFWCSKKGDNYSAVTLCAATLSAREKIGFPVGAQAKEARRRALEASDKLLDGSMRTRAETEGKRMSLNEVVALALQLAAVRD